MPEPPRDEPPPGPPDEPAPSEVYILGDDGDPRPAPAHPRMPGPPSGATRRRAALGVVAVLIFGLGIAVGTHIGDGADVADSSGTSAPGVTEVASTTTSAGTASLQDASRTRSSVETSTGTSTETSAETVTGPAVETSAPISTAHGDSWPSAPNACGNPTPLARVGDASPLRRQTGLHLLAGSVPRPVDVDAGTVGDPLLPVPDGHVVTELAQDSRGTVAVIQPCDGFDGSRVVRVGPDGTVRTVLGADRAGDVTGLVTASGRVWAVVHTGVMTDDGPDPSTLVATDGSGTAVTLPRGFQPQAGWRQLIVGSYSLGAAGAPIQVYDLDKRAIVAQFAGQPSTFRLAGGTVVWAINCGGSCPVHSVDLATGTDTFLRTMPVGADGIWRAISPDGRRLAVLVPRPPGAGAGDPDALPQLVVVNLDSGGVTVVPGLDLGPLPSLPWVVFAPDSGWLAVAVHTVAGTQFLFYDRQLRGPYTADVSVPGPARGTLPLVLTGQS